MPPATDTPSPPPATRGVAGTFWLLVPKRAESPADLRSIELNGASWVLAEQARIPTAAEKAAFVCLSYAWGPGRAKNPLDDGRTLSDRTLPALAATIEALHPPAIWVDALCVPASEPSRTECLRSMGLIYSAAAQVVVVLSESCAALLAAIHDERPIEPAAVLVLEHDDWVSRSWTYQEIVNSRSTQFLAEGVDGRAVSGIDLLRVITNAISDYKKEKGLSTFKFRMAYPRLDALESLIADYMSADFMERSAFQIMAALTRRSCERAEDYFNAMIGALTTATLGGVDDPALHPAEYFMRICEARCDYSFIYTPAPRGDAPGRRWRPVAGAIPAVIPWYGPTERQTGRPHPTHLQLDNMFRPVPGVAGSDARRLVDWWLESDNAGSSSGEVAALILERLRREGFGGCGEYLEAESGYFFPWAPLAHPDDAIVVSREIKWAHGAPGLVLGGVDGPVSQFRGVGVFVGRVPKDGVSINVE